MVTWAEIGKTIANIAPLLGSVIAGPVGASLGGLVASALGAPENSPEKIMEAMNKDPDYILKIKQLEITHEEMLQKMVVQMAEMELQDEKSQREVDATDRNNARAMYQGEKRDFTPDIISLCLIIAFFFSTYYILTHEIPLQNKDIIISFMSILIAGFTSMLNFWFGSSSSSSKKNKIIGKFINESLPDSRKN